MSYRFECAGYSSEGVVEILASSSYRVPRRASTLNLGEL